MVSGTGTTKSDMALAERITVRDEVAGQDADVVLGEDWVNPETDVSKELRARRARRGLFALNQSPLTRKIIIFNLMALLVLVLGILYLNSSRDTLALQRSAWLVSEAELVADVLFAELAPNLSSFPSLLGAVALQRALADDPITDAFSSFFCW